MRLFHDIVLCSAHCASVARLFQWGCILKMAQIEILKKRDKNAVTSLRAVAVKLLVGIISCSRHRTLKPVTSMLVCGGTASLQALQCRTGERRSRIAVRVVAKAAPMKAKGVQSVAVAPPAAPPTPNSLASVQSVAFFLLGFGLVAAAAGQLSKKASKNASSAKEGTAKKTVVVTGAGGRTGRLIYDKLVAAGYDVRAVVRTAESAATLPAPASNVFVADCARDTHVLRRALDGADVLVIATSATPKMVAPPKAGERPTFAFPENGLPERVDWIGQRTQIAAARAAGVKHVLTVGSRGGTEPDSMLNKIGGQTNILLWKRKAEQYLVDSGIPFTIVRAGGLLDTPGGKRALIVGADDADLGARSVPRADVAEAIVQGACRAATGFGRRRK